MDRGFALYNRSARQTTSARTLDGFSYLSVLLSIVLGLGVANLLTGFARVIQMRARVKLYLPVLLWAFTLVLMHIQTWWMMYGMQHVPAWTFGKFALVLLQPVLLFFLSALIWPDFDRDEALDLKANYYAQTRWFFGILIAILLFSLLREYVLAGHLQNPVDFSFHLVGIVGFAGGAIFTNERYHEWNAPIVAATFVVYIGTLFAQLQ